MLMKVSFICALINAFNFVQVSKSMNAQSVRKCSHWEVTWKFIWESILERNHMNVMYVQRNLDKEDTFNTIYESTKVSIILWIDFLPPFFSLTTKLEGSKFFIEGNFLLLFYITILSKPLFSKCLLNFLSTLLEVLVRNTYTWLKKSYIFLLFVILYKLGF